MKNVNLKGQLSVAAWINERPVEIPPYFKMGNPVHKIGVSSRRPLEVSQLFLQTLLELDNLQANLRELLFYINEYRDQREHITTKAHLQRELEDFVAILERDYAQDETLTIDALRPDLWLQLSDLTSKIYDPNLDAVVYENGRIVALQTILRELLAEWEGVIHFLDSPLRKTFLVADNFPSFRKLSQTITWSLKYMQNFNGTGYETRSSFLALISKENKLFQDILSNARSASQLSAVNVGELLSEDKLNILYNLYEANERLLQFTGSPLSEILQQESYSNDFYSPSQDLRLSDDHEAIGKVQRLIAQEATKAIYQDLVFGTLDLAQADAHAGDILRISVLWYNKSGSDAGEPTELITAVFKIKETGWQLNTLVSMLLVNRINEELANPTNMASSKFKPASAVSLLWSYRNDGRKYRANGERLNYLLQGIKWAEPSVGLNLAYVDFNTENVLEIGAGPTLGLFRNKVLLHAGYNFHASRDQPFYWGIGFSFGSK